MRHAALKFLPVCAALAFVITGFRTLGAEAQSPRKRVPWSNSRINGSPEPPSPFITEPAFPKLSFNEPIDLVRFPGTKRLVMAEHGAKIVSFPNDSGVATVDMFADMKRWKPAIQEVYSVEFHPQFASNRFVYIWYILKPELPDGTHIARFKVNMTDPPTVDLSTETTIITWYSGGHNGGCMRFGKDGMMYISTGDGAGPDPPDILDTGQNVSDLLSSVLRIDVDHPDPGKGYSIPKDNPFPKMEGVRPEIFAYGFRNPWRMSIDQKTGEVWLGDVGWELWEMVYRVQSGGNYGWSIMEGTRQVIKADGKRGPTPILPPVMEHPHSEAASITGGYIYRGKQFAELSGSYVYGDFNTGKIWELRYDGARVTKARELVDTPFAIITFAEDHDNELLVVHFGGTIHRFVRNPSADKPSNFPRRLSETGIFADVKKRIPSPGVSEFSVNTELWADHVVAQRHVALPEASSITFNQDGGWVFPRETVLAKTYSIEMTRGKPQTRLPIETQILHFNGEHWYGYTYEWNADATDAVLVAAAGKERSLSIKDTSAPTGLRKQTWRYHSRAECLRCHNMWNQYTLAFTPSQLNRENQLESLVYQCLLEPEVLRAKLPKPYPNPKDTTASLTDRARAYLHANCSHCHREHAGGSVLTFMNFEHPMEKAGMIGAKPAQGTMGITGARVVAPGDPGRSVLFYRMSKLGKGHMPYLGASSLDDEGVALIHDWIKSLPGTQSSNDPDEAAGQARMLREKDALAKLYGPSSGGADARTSAIKELLGDISGAIALAHSLTGSVSPVVRDEVLTQVASVQDGMIRDLFERFLPEEKRIKTLGTTIVPSSILSLKGNAAEGRKVFSSEGRSQCQTCHKAEGVGRDFGPDLSQIGKKYTRAQILEHLIEPNKLIEPKFIAQTIETTDDLSITGFLIRRSDKEIVIKEATGVERSVPTAAIRQMQTLKLSLMPEGLLQGMTAQEAADLIDYLATLK